MSGLLWFYLSKVFTGKAPITKLGMVKGNVFHKDLLRLTYGMKFKDLTDDFKLYITATEVLTGSLVVFSKENTPNVLVADAVRASSSIQGVFVPFGIEVNDLLGGIHIDNSYQLRQVDDDTFDTNLIINRYGIKNNTKLYLIDGGNNGNCRTDIAANIKSEKSQIVATSFT
jgi:predicted acylesterase/phospholipase RssA